MPVEIEGEIVQERPNNVIHIAVRELCEGSVLRVLADDGFPTLVHFYNLINTQLFRCPDCPEFRVSDLEVCGDLLTCRHLLNTQAEAVVELLFQACQGVAAEDLPVLGGYRSRPQRIQLLLHIGVQQALIVLAAGGEEELLSLDGLRDFAVSILHGVVLRLLVFRVFGLLCRVSRLVVASFRIS